jgi:hypothetical protein
LSIFEGRDSRAKGARQGINFENLRFLPGVVASEEELLDVRERETADCRLPIFDF